MKPDCAFIQREIGMSTNLVILGRPLVGLYLMSKAGHWEYLPWWFVDEDSMLSPLQLISFFFIFLIGQDARIYTNSRTRYELRKELTSGYSHTSPHTWSLQNFKCMEFKSPSVVVLHLGISRCCSRCSSHVCRCCLSVTLLDLPLERLGPKIPEGKLNPRTCSCFLLKGK